MSILIENDQIVASIKEKGAELCSLRLKEYDLEYLWQADPSFWAKQSPVLFPFVGTLRENKFIYHGRVFHCGRHGFAREKEFGIETKTKESVVFLLTSSTETMAIFPFQFEFRIHYGLNQNALTVEYDILNSGHEDLYFSVGGHPAFKLPLTNDTNYDDYSLRFEHIENAGRWPISADGLIELNPIPLIENSRILPLTKELFSNDALVFKNLNSGKIWLESTSTPRGLSFEFRNFPYLGLWAAKGAEFVCIEPWCGIADSINSTQELQSKEGINRLLPSECFKRQWTVVLK